MLPVVVCARNSFGAPKSGLVETGPTVLVATTLHGLGTPDTLQMQHHEHGSQELSMDSKVAITTSYLQPYDEL